MNKCKFYGGTEKITATSTKIKCSKMEEGGKIYENKDPEGAMISHCCWSGGKDCPLLSDNSSDDIDNEQFDDDELLDTDDGFDDTDSRDDELSEEFEQADDGASLEALATAFTQRTKMCPHYTDNSYCEAKPVFGGLDFKCEMCERSFCKFDDAVRWLSSCSTNPQGCIYYRNNPITYNEQPITTNDEEETDMQQIEIPSTTAISTERQEKAIKLHKQVLANGKIAADCMVAMGRDLKVIRDEKLFSEFDCENFEEYCEKKVGIGKRHGYNFIQVYERFGEQRLSELQGLGITKLLEIAKLDDADMADLMENGNVSEMSVRQLQAEMEKYKNKCEQLTLDLEDERDKNRILNESNDTASLETQIEELKGLLAAANQEKDQLEEGALNAEKVYKQQKAALIEEHRKEKQSLKNELAELKDIKEENDYLVDEISKLRKQKEPIIKTELSEEDMERLRDEGRDEERERYLGEHKVQEDRHKEEIKALKDKADDERITAVNAARKQEAAKYAAEIEKLKAENAALQSNAQPASAPSGGSKEQLQFLISEIERAFNASQEIIGNMDDKEQQKKYRKALLNALKIMEEDLDA